MAGQADGSIIIDTELRSDGFKAGSAELLSAIKALSDEMKNLRNTLTELFTKPLTPEVNTSSAERNVTELEARVRELESALDELQNAGGNNGSGPQVNMDGTTQRASDLQRQIDAVNTSVERLEPTFQKAMTGSESAMATFEGKASVLEGKIAELQERLDRVGQTKYPTQEYEAVCSEIEKTDQKLQSLIDRQEKMQAMGVSEDSSQWRSLQYDMDRVSERYHELIALKKQLEESGNATQMGADTAQYAQMEATLSAANSRLEEMRNSTGQVDSELSSANSSAERMKDNTGQTKGHMHGIATAAKKAASFIGKAAKSAVGALARGIKSAASHMARMVFHGKSMQGQFKGLISSAKKFTLSLLGARGIYALLRKAVSAYMAQNEELTNKLNACWSGIGNLLGPIITKLINLVAQAVAYVTSFLKLFGMFGSTATGAINNAGDAATGAIKELKRQLASFDELNVLSDNSSNNGSGNGNNDSSIELPEVTLPDWAKLLVEQLQAGDWAAAATTLANQLNSMIASVDWAGIGQKIGYYLNGVLTFLATFIDTFDWQALGSDLATMLNNIITSVDWRNLGKLLVAKWTILLKLLNGFFETFDGKAFGDGLYDLFMGAITACDWVELTGSLSQNISNFIQAIDFAKLGAALSTGIRTILQSLNAGITNFDWHGLGKKIADFLNGIDWSGIFSDLTTLIGNVVIGALDLLGGFVSEADWEGLADDIWSCLESLVNDIDWDEFGESLGRFISDAVTGILTTIGSLFSDHDWGAMIQDLSGSLGTALCSMIENIDWVAILESLAVAIAGIVTQIPGIIVGALGGIADILASIFEGIGLDGVAGFFKGIGDAMRNIGTWLKENLVDPVVNWVKDLFGIHSPSTVFAEIGDWLIQGLLQGISAAWHIVVDFFVGALEGLKSLFANAWEAIKSGASAAWDWISSTASSTWNGITGFLSDTWNGIKSGASSLWNSIKSGASAAWNWVSSTASSTWNGVTGFLSDTWSGIKSGASSLWNNIKSGASDAWNSVKSWTSTAWSNIKSTVSGAWDGIKSTASSGWETVKNGVSSAWDSVKSWTSTAWSNVKSTVSGAWDGLKSAASSGWNSIKTGISDAWNGVKSTTSSVWNNVESGLSSAWNSVKSTASSTWNGLKSTISSGWDSVKSGTSSIWNNVKSSLSSTWNSVKSTASSTWNGLKSTISSGWDSVKSTTSSVWDRVKSSLSTTWNNIKTTASNSWSGIKNTIQNQGWSGVGSNICSGISNGLSSGWNWLKEQAKNLAQNLLNGIKDFLGIHSPSTLFRDQVGLNIGYGIGEGVIDSQPEIIKSVSGVADAIAKEMNAGDYAIKNIVPVSDVNGAMVNFSDTINDSFTSMLDRLQDIAKHVKFDVPAVSYGVIPYKAAAAAANGRSTDIGTTIEASNDELADVITQVVANAASAIVTAIQNHGVTSAGGFDKAGVAEAVIQEINRRTRMMNKSPLLG